MPPPVMGRPPMMMDGDMDQGMVPPAMEAPAGGENDVVVKVVFTADNSQKSLRFVPEMTVQQQIESIIQKCDIDPSKEYLLFIPDQKKVMMPDKLVDSYHLEKCPSVEFRPKMAVLAVKLLDNSVKKKFVDGSMSVADVTKKFGELIGIQITDEFALQHDSTNEWLEPSAPLLEQWDGTEMLALRKKFFLDDKNISADDPMKLHLVYVECNTGILNGTTPVSVDEATELAALMLQAEQGNCDLTKQYPSATLRQYLPPQYRQKNLDKTIISLWKPLVRMSDINAKLRYVTAVRGLKTYGITIFNVQEKVPGQRKLQQGLLGITRSSVVRMRLDKTIVQDWPLKQIKRWAAGDGVFTLDFGNHSGEYYMVFTKEGERMSKMLSGYIDLLMKKRRDTGNSADEDVTEVATAEDVASAFAAHAIAHVGQGRSAKMTVAKKPQVSIVDVRQQIERSIVEFAKMAPSESVVGGEMQAPRFIADVANAIRTNLDELMSGDKARAGAALAVLAPLLEEFQRSYAAAASAGIGAGVLNLAANEDNLLSACKAVNDSVTQLLGSKEAIDSAAGISTGSHDVFDPVMFGVRAALAAVASQATAEHMNTPEMQRVLHELAHNVQFYIGELCDTAKLLQIKDPAQLAVLQGRLMMLGEQTSKLIRLMAPTSSEAQAQTMLAEMANAVKGGVAGLVEFAKENCGPDDEEYMARMWTAAQSVTSSLDQLLHASQAPGLASDVQSLEMYNAAQSIISHLGTFIDTRADQTETAEALKVVKEGLMTLIKSSKSIASSNAGLKANILDSAKKLINAIKILEDALRTGQGADSADVANGLDAVRLAVSEIVSSAGYEDLGKSLKAALIGSSAKTALASVMALRMQSLEALKHLKSDSPAHQALKRAADECVQCTQEFLNVLTLPLEEQEAKIVQAVTNFLPDAANLTSQALTVLPDISDKKTKNALAAQARATNDALTALSRINKAYQPHGNIALAEELEPISKELVAISEEVASLETAGQTATVDTVNAEQVRETAFRTLNAASRAVASSVAKMQEIATDELPIEADTMLKAVRRIAAAVKGFAGTTSNPQMRAALLKAASDFCNSVNDLTKAMQSDRNALDAPGELMNENMAKLIEAARNIITKEMEEAQAQKAKVVEDVAERELLGAANVIKASMAKLMAAQQAAMRNAQRRGISLDESGISEAILDTARNVVQTSATLLEHATDAQRELNGSAKSTQPQAQRSVYQKDPKWEQGLISAAKAVAGSVQFLVRAANDHMKGETSEYPLIAAAKTVAQNAVQLQTATRTKLNPMSPKIASITQASQAVNSASNNLVRAAAAHADALRGEEEERELREAVAEAQSATETQLKILQMEAQIVVNDLEDKLRQARQELAALRRKRYEDAYAKYLARLQGKDVVAQAKATQERASAQSGQQQPVRGPGGPAVRGRGGIPLRGGMVPRGGGMVPRGGGIVPRGGGIGPRRGSMAGGAPPPGVPAPQPPAVGAPPPAVVAPPPAGSYGVPPPPPPGAY